MLQQKVGLAMSKYQILGVSNNGSSVINNSQFQNYSVGTQEILYQLHDSIISRISVSLSFHFSHNELQFQLVR